MTVAERLRQGNAAIQRRMGDGMETLTASLGMAHTDDPSRSLDKLISQADKVFYTARLMSRDQVRHTAPMGAG